MYNIYFAVHKKGKNKFIKLVPDILNTAHTIYSLLSVAPPVEAGTGFVFGVGFFLSLRILEIIY